MFGTKIQVRELSGQAKACRQEKRKKEGGESICTLFVRALQSENFNSADDTQDYASWNQFIQIIFRLQKISGTMESSGESQTDFPQLEHLAKYCSILNTVLLKHKSH